MSSSGNGVLLIGNHAPPYGGVPNHIGHLASHLATRGWRVHVLSETSHRRGSYRFGEYWVHAPTKPDKLRNLARRPTRARVGRPLSARHGGLGSRAADLARANHIRTLVRRHRLDLLSVYHVLKPGLSAAYAAEETGLPLITTVFGEIYGDPRLHEERRHDVAYVLDRSALALSCSRHCADSPQSLLGLERRVDVLYYGVDVERFAPRPRDEALARDLGVAAEDLVIVFVGRMVEEMGLATLLDAVPALVAEEQRARVLVCGTTGALTARAHEVAACFPDRVSVHADVADELLPGVYGLADVVTAPSANARACLGLAIAEGMASGLPVVACAVGGTAEVLDDGSTGALVPAGDHAALAQALLAYLRDPSLRADHGAAGRRRCVERFDLREVNAECERLFLSVMSAPRHDPAVGRAE